MAEETTHKHFKHWIPDEAREHFREAREEMRMSWEGLFPPSFIEHRRKARKAMLLAWRSMIDHALERFEGSETSEKSAKKA
jgi:hypothetical protein